MLTKKDIAGMIAVISATYKNAFNEASDKTLGIVVNVWFNALKDYDQKLVQYAFGEVLKERTFQPTLADITLKINELQEATMDSPEELWNEFRKILKYTNRNAGSLNFINAIELNGKSQAQIARENIEQAYANASQEIKDYCMNWQEMVQVGKQLYDYEDAVFLKARFLKAIPRLRNRAKILREINEKCLISSTKKLLEEKE